MLIETRADAIDFLEQLKADNQELLRGSRIGLAGSFVRNQQKKKSDIDIIIEPVTDEGTYTTILYKNLSDYIDKKIQRNYDLLMLNFLKEQEEKDRNMLLEYGIDLDDSTPYQNILREVQWIE